MEQNTRETLRGLTIYGGEYKRRRALFEEIIYGSDYA